MKLFSCSACAQTLYFHNDRCVRCGSRLGFVPDRMTLTAFEEAGDVWREIGSDSGTAAWRPCANYLDYSACNWMVAADEGPGLCVACRLNRTIPNLSVPDNLERWQRLQREKNRLVYGLLRLGLPVTSRFDDPEAGLAFDFLADPDFDFREGEGSSVVIGHAGGIITLDVAEADDAVRERMRQQMAEPYRTLLGHFRHESGHYYWDRLVRDTAWLERFRERFGDERESYDDALARHYREGPPPDWPEHYVSAYASSHPWEDWAESWAHYLHIVDTLETAWYLGMRLSPRVAEREAIALEDIFDPMTTADFDAIVERWLPLTAALNALNHSMGQADAYPFVLAPPALEKMALVHDIVRDRSEPS